MSRESGAETPRGCLKTQTREGERPREPKHLVESLEIRAREDARPPEKPVFKEALRAFALPGFRGVHLLSSNHAKGKREKVIFS